MSREKIEQELLKAAEKLKAAMIAKGQMEPDKWLVLSDEEFRPSQPKMPTYIDVIPAGIHEMHTSVSGNYLRKVTLTNEQLIMCDNYVGKNLAKEVHDFWGDEVAARFKKMDILHRRGYLLHGIPGTGKTGLVTMIANDVVANGGIVLFNKRLAHTMVATQMIRSVEPTRPILVIFEDVDQVVSYSEVEFLSFLDGEDKVDHMVVLATTNHLNNLPPRIMQRPRRFDRIMEIKPPSPDMRSQYFTKKLEIPTEEVQKWVTASEDFTFAAMTELVVSVNCLEVPMADAAAKIRTLLKLNSL